VLVSGPLKMRKKVKSELNYIILNTAQVDVQKKNTIMLRHTITLNSSPLVVLTL